MYGRENLKPMSDLFLDMGDDVDGNRNYQPWAAYDKDDADNVLDAMEKQIRTLENDNEEMYESNLVLQARIKELESQLPKWISVEDVLPQWGKLVKIKFKDGKEDERRFSADYKWVSKGMQTCESVNVTHWMPLPPPPTTKDI